MLAVVVVRRLFWANAINFTCFVNLQAKEASCTVTKEYESWRAPDHATWHIPY